MAGSKFLRRHVAVLLWILVRSFDSPAKPPSPRMISTHQCGLLRRLFARIWLDAVRIKRSFEWHSSCQMNCSYAFESDGFISNKGGIMLKRSGNSCDLERLRVDIDQGVRPRSITPTKTNSERKSLPGGSAHSWLGGFVKFDGNQVPLFVRPGSRP